MAAADPYREALLRETREELAKADAKASILLAASGIAFAALLTAGSASSWYPDKLCHHAARIAAWVSLALMLGGIVLVGAAVKPRLRSKHETPNTIHYFGDVEAFRPSPWAILSRRRRLASARSQFESSLSNVAARDAEYVERLTDQIWSLSHIAYRKYRLVSLGMWLYAASIASATVALVVEKRWL